MRVLYFLISVLAAFWTPAAIAQGKFNAAITVNDAVITSYELDQRIKMLTVFRTAGDLNKIAREQLIDDLLKQDALDRAGVSLPPEGLAVAMSDFAGRANLDTEQFVTLLAQNGVDRPTIEQFVRIGLTWRWRAPWLVADHELPSTITRAPALSQTRRSDSPHQHPQWRRLVPVARLAGN